MFELLTQARERGQLIEGLDLGHVVLTARALVYGLARMAITMEKTRVELIEELNKQANGGFSGLLGKAYDAGLLEGYEQARREIMAKMENLLAPTNGKSQPAIKIPSAPVTPSKARVENRALPGTVRPAIKELMRREARGLRTDEILSLLRKDGRGDIKPNTVRGTLNVFRGMGLTEKRGGLWFLIETKAMTAENGSAGQQGDLDTMLLRPH